MRDRASIRSERRAALSKGCRAARSLFCVVRRWTAAWRPIVNLCLLQSLLHLLEPARVVLIGYRHHLRLSWWTRGFIGVNRGWIRLSDHWPTLLLRSLRPCLRMLALVVVVMVRSCHIFSAFSICMLDLSLEYRGHGSLCLSQVTASLVIFAIKILSFSKGRLHRKLLRVVQYLNETLMTLVFCHGLEVIVISTVTAL